MKQTYLKFSMLLLSLVMGLSSAWAEEVTFTFKTDTDITYTATGTSGGGAACEVSKSNVILTGTNAYTASTKTLSVYAKSTLTITAPGLITQIDLAYNGKVYPFDEAVGDGTKGSKYTTSGENKASYTPETPAASITLNNPNGGKTEILWIKITYAAGEIISVTGVSLDMSSNTIMQGEKFDLVATVSPDNALNKGVIWSSSDETVAKVSNGTVTGIKPGDATITVTTSDGGYTATCAVKVTEKQKPTGAVFFETFDGCNGAGGNDGVWSGITTTAEFEGADNEWTTEGTVYAGSMCASIRKNSDAASGLTTPALGVYGDGEVQFNAESWGNDTQDFYLDIVGDGTFVDGDDVVSLTNNSTTAKVKLQKSGTWTTYNIAITGCTPETKIRFYAAQGKRVFLDEVIVYNTVNLNITDAKYSTICTPFNIDIPEGVTAYWIMEENNDNVLDLLEYGNQKVLYAPAPVLLYSETPVSKTYYGVPSSTIDMTTECTDNNFAYGVWVDTPAPVGSYVLQNHDGHVAFYRVGEDVQPTVKACHLYLKPDTSSEAKSLEIADNEVPLAITAIEALTSGTAKIYDINGRQLQKLQKGLNIVNGVKVLVK